jgi:hypothetical protein
MASKPNGPSKQPVTQQEWQLLENVRDLQRRYGRRPCTIIIRYVDGILVVLEGVPIGPMR